MINSHLSKVSLPEDRAVELAQCASLFIAPRYLPARLFMRLLGLIASTLLVVPMARVMMRPIQLYFLSCWKAKIHPLTKRVMVPISIIPYIQFWQNTDNLVKGLSYLPNTPSLEIETDACKTGWGGHLGPIKVQGLFPSHQLSLHINCKEMLAVHCTLKALLDQVRNQSVLVKTDNIATKQYILNHGGTGSPALCALAIKLLVWCQSQGITLTAEYIPGLQNTLADHLSR